MTDGESKAAHHHCRDNRREIETSRMRGCFHCLGRFAPAYIDRWINEGAGTALCALCQIDSVIGDASGYPVKSPDFLAEMRLRWFETSVVGSVG